MQLFVCMLICNNAFNLLTLHSLELLFQDPLPLPPFYIERPLLLQDISEKLLSSKIDNIVHVTVIIQGMAGFGKSTLATALCYHPSIKKYFSSGFLRITLGPMPISKFKVLSRVYQKLTGNAWTNPAASLADISDISCLSEEITTLCKGHPKLLVIIDDVWEVKDALDYAEIFCGCKIVLTTRRKDVPSFIEHKHEVCVDSMELPEAVQLLTSRINKLQIVDAAVVDQLNNLAVNLHKWPLLLYLVRAQLDRQCKCMPTSPLTVIERVTNRLYENGLTVFDLKNPDRRVAAEASIKASLKLLSPDDMNRMKKLVNSCSFGSATPELLLCFLWEISQERVEECCQELWSVGLISFAASISLFDDTACVEVHVVIKQYIFDSIDYDNLYGSVVLNSITDISFFDKYLNQLLERAEMHASDYNEFCSNFIEIIDSVIVPMQVHTQPMMMYLMVKSFVGFTKEILSRFNIPTPGKKTYMMVRNRHKNILLLLNDGKNEQAVACMIDFFKDYTQFFTDLCKLDSTTYVSSYINHSIEMLPQCSKILFTMRSNLYSLTVKKTATKEKMYDIIKDYKTQLNEAMMPHLHYLNEVLQKMLSSKPHLRTNSLAFQSLSDMLSPLQSANSNLSINEYYPMVHSHITQNQNALADAKCSIS